MKQEEKLSTKVTEDDIKDGVEDEFGVVYSRDGKRLLTCKKRELKDYNIKESTMVICDEAFKCCSFLRQITIPNSVMCIGNEAFAYCESLQRITILNSVTSIGESTFKGCENLQQITIPSSVQSIGKNAFYSCTSLRQITFLGMVKEVGNNSSCLFSLEDIIIPEKSLEHFKSILPNMCDKLISPDVTDDDINNGEPDEYGVVYSKDGKRLLKCQKEDIETYNVKDGTKIICKEAFLGCNKLNQIDIPNSVTSIGQQAFVCCYSLQQIIIPNSVTSIGEITFNYCDKLEKITILNPIIDIEDSAFESCDNLQEIIIPEGSDEHFKQVLSNKYWDKIKTP